MLVSTVRLSEIRIDGGTQARVRLDSEALTEYEAAYRRGEKFPLPVVFYDGTKYWLADGFHRVAAYSHTAKKTIECQIVKGSQADAIWYACGANRANGLRRTNEDKRRAAEMALRLRPDASDRAIADHVGVGHPLVADVRRESGPQLEDSSSSPRKGRDGKTRRKERKCGHCGVAGHTRRNCADLAPPAVTGEIPQLEEEVPAPPAPTPSADLREGAAPPAPSRSIAHERVLSIMAGMTPDARAALVADIRRIWGL